MAPLPSKRPMRRKLSVVCSGFVWGAPMSPGDFPFTEEDQWLLDHPGPDKLESIRYHRAWYALSDGNRLRVPRWKILALRISGVLRGYEARYAPTWVRRLVRVKNALLKPLD